jgi:hypothetical protein
MAQVQLAAFTLRVQLVQYGKIAGKAALQLLFAHGEQLDGLHHHICKVTVVFPGQALYFCGAFLRKSLAQVIQHYLFTVTGHIVYQQV